jgi:hypothetical protein
MAKIFEGVSGVERLDAYRELLAIAGRVQRVLGAPVHIGELQLVDQLEHFVIGGVQALRREEPVHGILELGLVDLPGNPSHLADADSAPQANNPGKKGLRRRRAPMVALLPVRELLQETTIAIDRGEDFQKRDILPGREKHL